MLKLSSGWSADVERGPDWLYVRLKDSEQEMTVPDDLAELLGSLMQQYHTHRLVVELDALPSLRSGDADQLAMLSKKIREGGGLMRVCGANGPVRETLKTARLDPCFSEYRSRQEAVMGNRPGQPR